MAYELEVPVRHRTLWLAFTDPERLARAVPGLTVDAVQPVPPSDGLDGVPGDVVAGRLKLRVGGAGGTTITYRGTATIAAAEAREGTLDVAVDVAQARGNGALAGYLRIALRPTGASGERTAVSIVPELELSGRALDLKDSELADAARSLAGEWISALAAAYQEADAQGSEGSEGSEDSEDSEPVAEVEPAVTEPGVEAEPVVEAVVEVEAEEAVEVAEAAEAPEAEPAVAKALIATRLESEPLFDDSLSTDPLEPVWRGEFERSPWVPVIAALTLLALVRRRRRRRRRTG